MSEFRNKIGFCEYCGDLFTPKNKGIVQRFCSQNHQVAAWRKQKSSGSTKRTALSTPPPVPRTLEVGLINGKLYYQDQLDKMSIWEKKGGRLVGKCAYQMCDTHWELDPDRSKRIKRFCCPAHRAAKTRLDRDLKAAQSIPSMLPPCDPVADMEKWYAAETAREVEYKDVPALDPDKFLADTINDTLNNDTIKPKINQS